MRTTPRNPQPLKDAIKTTGRSYADIASEIGCPVRHLTEVAQGRVSANKECRARLPEILGKPLSELLTPDMLSKPCKPYVRRAPFPRKADAA